MTREEIIKGIKVYEREQNVLIRLIRLKKELVDDDFDRLFSDYKIRLDENHDAHQIRRKPKIYMRNYDWWLKLLQYMQAAGIIKGKKKGKHIVYSINE